MGKYSRISGQFSYSLYHRPRRFRCLKFIDIFAKRQTIRRSSVVACSKMSSLTCGNRLVDAAANDFEIALLGIESYCCLDMTHVKDNTVNEFAHARKITHLVCPTLYIVQLNLVLTYFRCLKRSLRRCLWALGEVEFKEYRHLRRTFVYKNSDSYF